MLEIKFGDSTFEIDRSLTETHLLSAAFCGFDCLESSGTFSESATSVAFSYFQAIRDYQMELATRHYVSILVNLKLVGLTAVVSDSTVGTGVLELADYFCSKD